MEDIFNIQEITEALQPAIDQLRTEIEQRELESEEEDDPPTPGIEIAY